MTCAYLFLNLHRGGRQVTVDCELSGHRCQSRPEDCPLLLHQSCARCGRLTSRLLPSQNGDFLCADCTPIVDRIYEDRGLNRVEVPP